MKYKKRNNNKGSLAKLENVEIIKDYINGSFFDIDRLINEYYGYVYVIVKNFKGVNISNEDIEEIMSDVFLAMWKNYKVLKNDVCIKPYLAGIARNIIKNKYRNININYSIYDYEKTIPDITNIEEVLEEKEQDKIIRYSLKNMKKREYKVFMMYFDDKYIVYHFFIFFYFLYCFYWLFHEPYL